MHVSMPFQHALPCACNSACLQHIHRSVTGYTGSTVKDAITCSEVLFRMCASLTSMLHTAAEQRLCTSFCNPLKPLHHTACLAQILAPCSSPGQPRTALPQMLLLRQLPLLHWLEAQYAGGAPIGKHDEHATSQNYCASLSVKATFGYRAAACQH